MSTWWIDEPFLLGSSNPDTAQLEDLYRDGFRIIVSLLDENEQRPRYDPGNAVALGFKRYPIPIRDLGIPSLEKVYEFLDYLKRAKPPEKVLVHCEGGSGRTGTMAAAYWIVKGGSATEAIDTVRRKKPTAIETEGQERILKDFEKDFNELHFKAIDTFRKLVALLYREIGVLDSRNHRELASKRNLQSGFFANPARKRMAREIYQRTKTAPKPDAPANELETITGLSLHDIERGFRDGDWRNPSGGYSYGGPKWGAIASATVLLRDAIENRDASGMRRLLKEIDALEHNNGRIVTKFSELA